MNLELCFSGTGTLYFFGIDSHASNSRSDETTFYDSNGDTCGTSTSIMQYNTFEHEETTMSPSNFLGKRKIIKKIPRGWDTNYYTNYYNSRKYCGSSQSRIDGNCLNTSYYVDTHPRPIGKSISKVISDGVIETIYYRHSYNSYRNNYKDCFCGTSRSWISDIGKVIRMMECNTRYDISSKIEDRNREQQQQLERQAIERENAERRRQQIEKQEILAKAYRDALPLRQAEEMRRRNKKIQKTIGELSSWYAKNRKSAAWNIKCYIERERTDKMGYEGQYSSTIEFGAVKALVYLLADRDFEVREQAQITLLHMSRLYSDDNEKRSCFLEKIKIEAPLIIDIVRRVIRERGCSLDKKYTHREVSIVWNILEIFNTLPLEDSDMQDLIMQKKMIPFLAEMKRVYMDYNSDSTLGKNIAITFEKMSKLNEIYREEIISAEQFDSSTALLKNYYLSQVQFSMFNASATIFDGSYNDHIKKVLRERATKNPNGASEKTLNHFGL